MNAAKLKTFVRDNPDCSLRIVEHRDHLWRTLSAVIGVKRADESFDWIQKYSRTRDARRAMRSIGFVQEGSVWRDPTRRQAGLPATVESSQTGSAARFDSQSELVLRALPELDLR